jgi:rod shape-determining protein MreD
MRNQLMPSSRVIILSFVVAFMLDIIPLPQALLWWRPQFALLVLLYWVMISPYRISVGIGFVIGLLADLFNGSVLGQSALVFVILAYLTAKFAQWLRVLSWPLQSAGIFLLVFLGKAITYFIMSMHGQAPNTSLFFASPFTSAILWAVVSATLLGSVTR